jgi:hypothetical protein|tara:strand:+ start:1981 stop:2601 length:621 start_codon:yes stop_codon:yes gene_type:complete
MAFDVSSFKNALPNGGARTGLFNIRVPMPDGVDVFGHGPETSRQISVTANASSIPASTIEPTDINYFGRVFRVPGTRTFEDWTTTIYVDETFRVRDFFEQWSDRINGMTTNRTSTETGLGGGYTVDAEVIQYAKNGNSIRKYILVDAWPTTVGASELAWEGNDVQTVEVTWAYTHWEASSISDKTNVGAVIAELDESFGANVGNLF